MLASYLIAGVLWSSVAFGAADGSLDLSFGTSNGLGRAGITDAAGTGALGPVIQPDGKILICDTRTTNGQSGYDFFVARYNSNGTLDSTFSFDGKTTIDFDGGAGKDECTGIALQSDGKIVVVGITSGSDKNENFAIARLNSDGTLDTTSFGAGTGKVIVPFDIGGDNNDDAKAVAIQSDGKIVVAGTVETAANNNDFGIVRLNADGSRDGSFNLTGKVTVGFDFAGSDFDDTVSAVAIDASGNIVVAGNASRGPSAPTSNDFAVVRLLPNGQLDSNFDADGRATVGFDLGGNTGSNDDQLAGLTILRDGNIVLFGQADTSTTSTPNYDMAVARLFPDGSLDLSFGLGGKAVVAFDLTTNGFDNALAAVEQENGKLVLVGDALYSPTPYGLKAAALRFNRDGSLDAQFGSSGKEVFDFSLSNPSSQVFSGVALQGTQIIVSGGDVLNRSTTPPQVESFVARLGVDLIFANGFE